jgi:hypothetical protein
MVHAEPLGLAQRIARPGRLVGFGEGGRLCQWGRNRCGHGRQSRGRDAVCLSSCGQAGSVGSRSLSGGWATAARAKPLSVRIQR